MQNVLWDALGESSKQLAVNSPLFHLLWRMFGPWECKPKREATYSIKRKWIFFFSPECELQTESHWGQLLDLHQAASHMGDFLGDVTGGIDLVGDG